MSEDKKKSGVHAGKLPDGKGHSSIVKDKDGIPLVEPPRHKSLLGTLAPPDTEGKTYLETEKTKMQVEILLIKGMTRYSGIAAMLGIDVKTAKKYVEEVKYRWAGLGGMPRMRQLRGEAKARLDILTTELWVIIGNSESEAIKVTCIGRLIDVHDRQLILDGLTQKTLPLIASEVVDESGEDIAEAIRDHARIAALGKALIEYTKKNDTDIVDAEFEEVDGSDGGNNTS